MQRTSKARVPGITLVASLNFTCSLAAQVRPSIHTCGGANKVFGCPGLLNKLTCVSFVKTVLRDQTQIERSGGNSECLHFGGA